MIKWIRWQGLVAFFILLAGLMAFWVLFIDGIVGSVIEQIGMSIVGAEVDVKADVKLFPLGITLNDLQVTNPDLPESNSFECRHIGFNVDTLNLLRRKVIINEMAVEGMRFDTKRARPGKVGKKVKEQQKKAGEERGTLFGLPVQAPDIKTILKNENLESVKLIETTKADFEKRKADWQKRIDELPNKAKLDAYRERIENIRQLPKGDVFGMAGKLGEVRAVRRDIEQDLQRVSSAQTAFSTDLSSTKEILVRAERAPFEDVRRLRDKYSISPAGLQNMTQLLFGDKIAAWTRSGLLWYNRLQPVVERTRTRKKDVAVVKHLRGRGVDVRFKEYRPLPDFLIDRTALSAETTAGILAGTIRNITPDQNTLRQPLTFALTGEKMPLARSMALTGALNHIEPAKPEDTAVFAMRAYRLQNLVLSDNKNLPIALQDALVDLDLNGSFASALRAKFSANINSAKMKVGGEGDSNLFAAAVRSALSKVSKFQLNGNISGTLQDYNVSISSDLDKVLKNAVSSVVREQSAKLEQQLKAAIQETTGGPLKELQASFGGLNQKGIQLDSIQNQLNGLLQEAIKSAGGGGGLRLP